MICICGVCIPYSALWPIVLLFLRQIYTYSQHRTQHWMLVNHVLLAGLSDGSYCRRHTMVTNTLDSNNEQKSWLYRSISFGKNSAQMKTVLSFHLGEQRGGNNDQKRNKRNTSQYSQKVARIHSRL